MYLAGIGLLEIGIGQIDTSHYKVGASESKDPFICRESFRVLGLDWGPEEESYDLQAYKDRVGDSGIRLFGGGSIRTYRIISRR